MKPNIIKCVLKKTLAVLCKETIRFIVFSTDIQENY